MGLGTYRGWSTTSALKSQRDLALENVALRHQLRVLQRQSGRPQLKGPRPTRMNAPAPIQAGLPSPASLGITPILSTDGVSGNPGAVHSPGQQPMNRREHAVGQSRKEWDEQQHQDEITAGRDQSIPEGQPIVGHQKDPT